MMSWVGCLLTDSVLPDTSIHEENGNNRIWLFSANKIKSSESVIKQPTQLIIAVELRHISDEHIILNPSFMTSLIVFIYVQEDIFRYQHLKCLHNHQFHNCTYDVINYAISYYISHTNTHILILITSCYCVSDTSFVEYLNSWKKKKKMF